MEKYKIVEPIVLAFIFDDEQVDCILEQGIIETDKKTIWYIYGDLRHESITMPYAVPLYVRKGKLECILS